MNKITMLIGLPGSGKSTWAVNYVTEHPKENIQIYSSDFYRLCMFGDENDQTHNNEVFTAMYKDIREAYAEGVDIIIDATNLSFKDRQRTRNSLKGIPIDSCVVFATPIEACVERDRTRHRTVGAGVIKRCACKFDMPTYDEFKEIVVYGDNDCSTVSDISKRMDEFEQHNPHHKYTVGMHCWGVACQFPDDRILYRAGLWHDVGKLFTQSFDDKGVAHYYQHANYSTYFMLCYNKLLFCDTFDEMLEVLFYINQHMHIRDILKSPKAVKKYKALWGEEKFNKLVEFNKADNKGSGTEDKYEEIKEKLTL